MWAWSRQGRAEPGPLPGAPRGQDQAARDAHDDDNVIQAHPSDVDQVDGQDFVTDLEAAAGVDAALQGDSRDEDSVASIDPVPFSDVQSQGLAGSLDNLHKTCA